MVDTVIDMAEPAPGAELAADPHAPAATADPDVVVLADDPADPDAPKLPSHAVLLDDGSVRLPLKYPVVFKYRKGDAIVREERFDEFVMHRLNGAMMRAVMNAGEGRVATVGIAQSLRMNQAKFDGLFDRMDASDTAAAAQVFGFFLGGGKPTGTSR